MKLIFLLTLTAIQGVFAQSNSIIVTPNLSLNFLENIEKFIKRDDGSFLYANNNREFYERQSNDYKIEIYEDPTSIYDDVLFNCSPPYLGASNAQWNTANSVLWGEVDYSFSVHDAIDELSGEEPFCRPPIIKDLKDRMSFEGSAAFAFCSQKDEKTVAICLSQQTKNEAQAKKIFESFRWLEESGVFSDVYTEDPNLIAITYVKDQGIVSGYPDGTYKPNNPINRAEFTKIIAEATLKDAQTDCAVNVTDLEQNSWYEEYVQQAYCANLISGYPDQTFRPANNINAAEVAKIVANAFNLDGLPAETPQGEDWYVPYVHALQTVNAWPESIGTDYGKQVTRGEMAEVIYKVMTYEE